MEMKTLTVNGQTFIVADPDALHQSDIDGLVSTQPQQLTQAQMAQARANIGAAQQDEYGVIIKGDNGAEISLDAHDREDETGHKESILQILGYSDGAVRLTGVADGKEDWDAATVGQVNDTVESTKNALTERTLYKNLYGRVEITADDITAAGDEGITCITIGSDDVDLSGYNEFAIKIYVPADTTQGSEKKRLCVCSTSTNAYNNHDKNTLFFTQSLTMSSACVIDATLKSLFVVKANFTNDTFLYGEVIKNGYSTSHGYPGVQAGWVCIASNFKKSEKKYFHIYTHSFVFKFPAGTYVEVYAR